VLAAICQGRTTIAQTSRAAKNGSPTCGSSRKKQDGGCWQLVPLFVRPWRIAVALAQYAKGLSAIHQSQGSRRQVLAKSADFKTEKKGARPLV
jgi:hypothetical protein